MKLELACSVNYTDDDGWVTTGPNFTSEMKDRLHFSDDHDIDDMMMTITDVLKVLDGDIVWRWNGMESLHGYLVFDAWFCTECHNAVDAWMDCTCGEGWAK